jgi:hypothetical protein
MGLKNALNSYGYLGASDARIGSCDDDGVQRIAAPSLDSIKDSVKYSRDVWVSTITPAVSVAPAYTAGDAVGGKQILLSVFPTPGRTAQLQQVHVLDKGNQKAAFDLLIFDSDPTAATITDNAAFVASTTNLNVVARIPFLAADYATVGTSAYATKSNLNIEVFSSTESSLFAAMVTSGTPTYVSVSDIQIKYAFVID